MTKYSKKSQSFVEDALHRMKKNELMNSSGDKVSYPMQASALVLAETRPKGAKVPAKKQTIKSRTRKPVHQK
jgi:hypothetical protein